MKQEDSGVGFNAERAQNKRERFKDGENRKCPLCCHLTDVRAYAVCCTSVLCTAVVSLKEVSSAHLLLAYFGDSPSDKARHDYTLRCIHSFRVFFSFMSNKYTQYVIWTNRGHTEAVKHRGGGTIDPPCRTLKAGQCSMFGVKINKMMAAVAGVAVVSLVLVRCRLLVLVVSCELTSSVLCHRYLFLRKSSPS